VLLLLLLLLMMMMMDESEAVVPLPGVAACQVGLGDKQDRRLCTCT